jgi:hypothetical protein
MSHRYIFFQERKQESGKKEEGLPYLANLSEGCTSAPLDNGVHQLDLEG